MVVAAVVLIIQGSIILLLLGLIIYLIVKRIEAKRHEDFEDRDN